MPNSDKVVIRETLLSKKPERDGYYAGLISFVCILAPTVLYWQNMYSLPGNVEAIPQKVFGKHEYWRLLTAITIHSDLAHLLGNGILLIFLAYLLYSYFGPLVYPCLMVSAGVLVNYVSLKTYPANASLVGASGLVYVMAFFWLSLYLLIQRRYSVAGRLLRCIGFALVVFFPTSFDPQVSYRTHAIGAVVGILLGIGYFLSHKKMIREAEVMEIEE
jgi:membrane associated rhomboid family serine protease